MQFVGHLLFGSMVRLMVTSLKVCYEKSPKQCLAQALFVWNNGNPCSFPLLKADAGKHCRQRRRGWQRMRWLDSITDSMDMNLNKLHEIVKDRGAWHAADHEVAKSWAQLSDCTIKECLFSIQLEMSSSQLGYEF